MSENNNNRTLGLLFPQWQGGGNNPPYILGAHLLNWLAPKSAGPYEEVPLPLIGDINKTEGPKFNPL